jgi:hypothetical protein
VTGTDRHPSFWALDGIRLGRAASADERRHLASCAACAGHLAAGPEQAAASTRPAWLAALPPAAAGAQAPPARRSRRWWAWLLPLAPVMAGLVILAGRPHPPAGSDHRSLVQGGRDGVRGGVREKAGAPALRLFIKRGAAVFAWDGRSAVRPGDRLRLELRPAGYGFVSVAGRSGDQQVPAVLYDGALDSGAGSLLPVSFRVDDRGTEEVLSVILGRAPVPPRLHAEADVPASEARTWRQILVLPKQPMQPRPGEPGTSLRGGAP